MTSSRAAGAFPSAVYRDTVLRPAFAGARAHHHLMRAVDRAHLVMLAEQGIVSRPDARRIVDAIEAIDAALDLEQHEDAGTHEDLFYLLEAKLIAAVGPDIGGNLHLARSRNDLEATMFKLALKQQLRGAMRQLAGLLDAMLGLAERERRTIILAYTHGQPAQPTTLGHYLGAMIECLLRHSERLVAAYGVVDLSPLGAAAITTTGYDVSRERTAELLGFAGVQENSYGCIAAADYLTATYSALQLTLIDIGRLCQDLAFWCGFEVDQLRAADGFVQVSSIMPQKRNPLAIEHLRTLASLGVGQCATVIGTMHNAPFADMVDAEAPTQQAGSAAFVSFGRVMTLLSGFLDGVTVNADSVARNIAASTGTMTELADSLVRREKISFRTAHHITSELARQLLAERLTMAELPRDRLAAVFRKHVGRDLAIDDATLAEMVSANHFVAVRDTLGGPGPAALDASLARYRDGLDAFGRAVAQFADNQAQAEQRLAAAVAAL